MSVLTSVKRVLRQHWHLAMAVAAVVLVVVAVALGTIGQDLGSAVALFALAVVMVGIGLLLARTLRLQRDNAELRRDLAELRRDLAQLSRQVSDLRPHSSLRRSLEAGPVDEATRIGELLSALRRESDLRHAELRLMTDDITTRADRTDQILDDLRAEVSQRRESDGSGR